AAPHGQGGVGCYPHVPCALSAMLPPWLACITHHTSYLGRRIGALCTVDGLNAPTPRSEQRLGALCTLDDALSADRLRITRPPLPGSRGATAGWVPAGRASRV